MRKHLRLILLSLFTAFVFLNISYAQLIKPDLNPTDYLVPYPQSLSLENKGDFILSNGYTIEYTGVKSRKLLEYVQRKDDDIKSLLLAWTQKDNRGGKPVIEIKCSSEAVPDLDTDESYTLEVKSERIVILAITDIGAMRGVETLLQLIQTSGNNVFIPCLKIADSPRFQWRGLMMDVCRHFIPKSVILKNLDAMAMFKMNVLHWHLSEDQGFRIECKTFPKLHEMGSDGQYFTHKDVKEIIKYANDRGIRVIPEFDIPGHSSAWFVGYPEYASLPGKYEIERHYGVFDPTFDPTREETYEFFDKFFAEMSQLFNDEYIHIGGDENNGRQWDSSKAIQEFKKANNINNNHELQAYFNRRIQKIIEKHGKKMIGWDEILSTELPGSILIQSWQGKQGMITAAKNGYYSILSNGYYIDLCQSMVDHYYNDPLPSDIGLTDDEKKYILGGEATMWAELVDSTNVFTRIWPRAAAIAEVFWSGRKTFGMDSIYNNEVMFERFNESLLWRVNINLNEKLSGMMTASVPIELTAKVIVYLSIPEPVKYYNRHKYTKYSQFTPLNRFVDVLKPDAPLGVFINNAIGRKLRGDEIVLPDLQYLGTDFSAQEIELMKSYPKLSEILPLFENINISIRILKELFSIRKDLGLSEEKYNYYKEELLRIKAPVAELEIPYADNLLKLLEYIKQN